MTNYFLSTLKDITKERERQPDDLVKRDAPQLPAFERRYSRYDNSLPAQCRTQQDKLHISNQNQHEL